MIPVGYMLKSVVPRPEWNGTKSVADIYSLSGCVSLNFHNDYVNFWKHNGYWLFDSPEILRDLAKAEQIDVSKMMLFYYEAYENEYDDKNKKWSPFFPEPAFPTDVVEALKKRLEGYDVTTFSVHTSPECSPLSCIPLAPEIKVNKHCLFETFEEAKNALENGKFDNSEPGPFRIHAVYSIESPSL